MARTRAKAVRRIVALSLVATLAATCGATSRTGPQAVSPGLIGGGGWPFAHAALDPAEAAGARYLPDSSAVLLADGRVRLIPSGGAHPITVDRSDPRVAAALRGDRTWLAHGTVPTGGTPTPGQPDPGPSQPVYRDMAVRALLDLRLLTRPNGASTASWFGAWRYVWPRDAAFASAAFVVTGHPAEARRVLRFLARVQSGSGLWAARYHADGRAVIDGREPQLDSLGWVLWASWLYRARDPRGAAALPELWPMVRRAADRIAESLDAEGLPPPTPDYFERSPSREQDPRRPTLGVVGPALAGLRSAADFARQSGHLEQARRWQHAAHRLSAAVARTFTPLGYPRSPVKGGLMDTSVTFLAPPFGPADPGVNAAVLEAADRLTIANGGVLPGEQWSGHRDVAWTPEMALFTLNAAASGRLAEARSRLDWLSAHRTSMGSLPEKVDAKGRQAAVAPLGWTASLVLLSLDALDKPLPVPPG
jgi:hypothetical protein